MRNSIGIPTFRKHTNRYNISYLFAWLTDTPNGIYLVA